MDARTAVTSLLAMFTCLEWANAEIGYSIFYTEQAGGTKIVDAFNPRQMKHSKIVQRDPDGTRTVLVDPGPNGAAWDGMPSLDGKWLYYAAVCDFKANSAPFGKPLAGSDIWRLNLETGFKQQLTFQEKAPFHGRSRSVGAWNMGPCPLADRLLFTSDREVPGQNQLWSCDLDGKNVEKVGYLNMASALHPVRLSNGRILFSTQENQGLRDPITWGLWTTLPDGRDFEPFYSAYFSKTILHWHTEAANKNVVTAAYYANNNSGFGSLFTAPLEFPGYEHRVAVPFAGKTEKIFLPKLSFELTPWTTWFDIPAPFRPGSTTERIGKVTHPAATPDPNKILVTYAPGGVNVNSPDPIQAGIYLLPTAKSAGPAELELVVDDPNVQEWQAQALVPYSAMFSDPFNPQPKPEDWLPNAGSEHLPAGTPYALIGTSSLYVRETDELVKNHGPGLFSIDQGGNRYPFSNSQIAKLRILTMQWRTGQYGNEHKYRTASGFNDDERLAILGEVDVRRFDAQGNRILDPAGNPDTSFLAKIRADEPSQRHTPGTTFGLASESTIAAAATRTLARRPGLRSSSPGPLPTRLPTSRLTKAAWSSISAT